MAPKHDAKAGNLTRGVCEVCGKPTQAYDPYWTIRCPEHWQALVKS